DVIPTCSSLSSLVFFQLRAPPEFYTLSLHVALPISTASNVAVVGTSDSPGLSLRLVQENELVSVYVSPDGQEWSLVGQQVLALRSEEHTSELQSRGHLVCRLLLEKKKERNTLTPASE